MVPTAVAALRGKGVTDVACGGSLNSGDMFYLASTESGSVYSWGDNGEFGKLGRACENSSKIPKVVERLQGLDVERVFCGGQVRANENLPIP